MSAEKILIFGHTGFIGTHMESFFKSKYPEVTGKSLPDDITDETQIGEIKKLLDERTAVIMLSAIKREHGDNPDTFLKNVMMVRNICKALEEKKVRQFIYFSSAAVYGEDVHNLSISEDTAINPTTFYGIAKFACERMLSKTTSPLAIVRPPAIYGPGDTGSYGPSAFLNSAMKGETITLWGDGSEKREFVFVDDVVKLVDAIIRKGFNGVLNAASGKSNTFAEIIEIISSLTNSKVKVATRERTKEKADHVFRNDKLMQAFPDMAFTSLTEGLQRMAEKK
ncbi:NAD(P)-dependent oxidoreductase [Candidatus Woesearchaeota archaeon]|nr:NAD(P)-dependent oxidoreductase [Candidatus Woesearchaeota archaeon]